MSFEGTFVNGTVVFETPPELPNGTVVKLTVEPQRDHAWRTDAQAGGHREGIAPGFCSRA
jgi:hypothetical protein